MNFKKVFCLLLSVMMIITAFSASAVSAGAETGMPGTAFGGSQPPEKPDGEAPGALQEGMGGPGGGMGTPPDGVPGSETGTPPDGIPGGKGGPGGGMPGGGPGSSSADIDYSGAVEIASADTQENQAYETSAEDQSALLISTAEDVNISNPTVRKSGSSDGGDSCNFYGLNAAVLCHDDHRRHDQL